MMIMCQVVLILLLTHWAPTCVVLGCIHFQFTEQPSGLLQPELRCSPYDRYNQNVWLLKLRCIVTQISTVLYDSFDVHWFQKTTSGEIIDHGRPGTVIVEGNMEKVVFGQQRLNMPPREDYVGEYWCQIVAHSNLQEEPVYLGPSNSITVHEPAYYINNPETEQLCSGLIRSSDLRCGDDIITNESSIAITSSSSQTSLSSDSAQRAITSSSAQQIIITSSAQQAITSSVHEPVTTSSVQQTSSTSVHGPVTTSSVQQTSSVHGAVTSVQQNTTTSTVTYNNFIMHTGTIMITTSLTTSVFTSNIDAYTSTSTMSPTPSVSADTYNDGKVLYIALIVGISTGVVVFSLTALLAALVITIIYRRNRSKSIPAKDMIRTSYNSSYGKSDRVKINIEPNLAYGDLVLNPLYNKNPLEPNNEVYYSEINELEAAVSYEYI